MKLITFEVAAPIGPVERLGALSGGRAVDLNSAHAAMLARAGKPAPQRISDAFVPSEMTAFLEMGDDALAEAKRALEFAAAEGPAALGVRGERLSYSENDVRLRAPLRPRALRDFFAFEDHALQGAKRRGEPLAQEWYDQPVYYKGNHREIYGPDAEVPWPSYTRKLDFECEIACVVGRKGRDLSPEDAARHIAGYTIFNDLSARDIQKNEMVCRMGPAKGKDFANVLGPYLLTADEMPDIDDLEMAVIVNGEKWSSGRSKGRYWSFPVMLSHVSQEETVLPGDVLGSGTYFKGCGLDLDRWIKPGDVVELQIERLGVLRTRVGAPTGQKQLKYPKRANGAHR